MLDNRELTAHAGHHGTPLPSAGSRPYALGIPATGGNTTFCNLAPAYDELDEQTPFLAREQGAATEVERFWRDLRTHSLHDPIAYKIREVGDYALNGRHPRPDNFT